MTNKQFWNNLPKEYQSILELSLKDAIEDGNRVALEKNVRDKNEIIESGVSNIHILNVNERKLWVNAMRPVWLYEDQIGSELILAAAYSC